MAAVTALICLLSVAVLVRAAIGATYTVGGPSKWGMGTDYASWAASQKFITGDSITFSYGELHNVLEVSKADYDSCSTSSPLTTSANGNTVIKLSSPGKRYFICGIPGHCAAGMKVEISTVAAAAGTASPPPSPSINPPPPPTPSPVRPKHMNPPASLPPQTPSKSHSASNVTSAPPTVGAALAPTREPSRPKPSVLEATAAPAAQPSAAVAFDERTKVAVGMAVSIMMLMALSK